MSAKSKLLLSIISILVLSILMPATAFADVGILVAGGADMTMQGEGNIATGTWGTCPWEISADGTLTVHPGEGQSNRLTEHSPLSSPWSPYANDIKRIVFASENGAKVIAPDSCYGLFYKLSQAMSIDLSGLDTSQTVDFERVFMGCSALKSVNVNALNTSNATNMKGMFYGCHSIESLDVSSFDTSKVVDFAAMFLNCESLKTLDVSNFDTRAVDPSHDRWTTVHLVPGGDYYTNEFDHMFAGCKSLESLNVANFDFSHATNIRNMFRSCSSLKALDLSTWKNMAGITDMSSLFLACRSLASLSFGPGFRFVVTSSSITSDKPLPDVAEDDVHTGKWERASDGALATSAELMVRDDLQGTWTLQCKPNSGQGAGNQPGDSSGQQSGGNAGSSTNPSATTPLTSVRRLAGSDRYKTMAAIVSEGFSKSEWAVVATGANFPDALAANALAGAYGCPVILTAKESLSPEARKALDDLGVKNAFIMGSEAAVSKAAENSIRGMGISVTRVAGADRQGTALAAMDEVGKRAGGVKTVIVATGYNFADALSVGPLCYAEAAPVVLTGPDGRLTAEGAAAIRALGGAEVVVLGDEKAVSAAVESQVGRPVTRLAGPDRYATCARIVEWELGRGLGLSSPAVATGGNYPDALAGASLCGSKGSVLVLASGSNTSAAGSLSGAQGAYIFGSEAAVPASVETKVKRVLG